MLEITNMNLDDFYVISNVLSDFDDFWSASILKSELQNDNSRYLVAKLDNNIIGFAGFTICVDEADITNIAVHKDFRQKKVGSALMQNLLSLACSLNLKSITLEVRENNVPAFNFYKKFGFEVCGLRKNYYNNTENAILMRKFF